MFKYFIVAFVILFAINVTKMSLRKRATKQSMKSSGISEEIAHNIVWLKVQIETAISMTKLGLIKEQQYTASSIPELYKFKGTIDSPANLYFKMDKNGNVTQVIVPCESCTYIADFLKNGKIKYAKNDNVFSA